MSINLDTNWKGARNDVDIIDRESFVCLILDLN